MIRRLRERRAELTRLTARRLALKAASRLRRKGYRSRLLVLHGKFEDDKSNWRASVKLPATEDSFVILARLESLFPKLLAALHTAEGETRLVGGAVRDLLLGDAVADVDETDADADRAPDGAAFHGSCTVVLVKTAS